MQHHYSENPTLCNLSWVKRIQVEQYAVLQELDIDSKTTKDPTGEIFGRDARLIQMMGIINKKIWSLCKSYGVFNKNGRLNIKKLKRLINISIKGHLTGFWSTQYMSRHLRIYWGGAFVHENSIRHVRDILSHVFGLFNFIKPLPGSTWRPPDLENFNLIECLLLADVLERCFLANDQKDPSVEGGVRKRTLNDLPCRLNATVRNVFNAVFQGVTEFGRAIDELEQDDYTGEAPIAPQPYTDEDIDETPEPPVDWSIYTKLIWQDMNDKNLLRCFRHRTELEERGIVIEDDDPEY